MFTMRTKARYPSSPGKVRPCYRHPKSPGTSGALSLPESVPLPCSLLVAPLDQLPDFGELTLEIRTLSHPQVSINEIPSAKGHQQHQHRSACLPPSPWMRLWPPSRRRSRPMLRSWSGLHHEHGAGSVTADIGRRPTQQHI